MIDGIINVYKESGFTSHDVVAKLRGILKQKRIGHTGTLDPEAQGVLPVCLGKATKVCDLITDREKTYRAVLLLGMTTDTQDTTGQILETKPVNVTEAEVSACIEGFVGQQEQIPPMYSAIKVGGRRLYDLARQGIEIERKPRQIEIREIEVEDVSLPEITMTVTCSKGTYIRTLCNDIGNALGCGGCMKSLLRTKAGPFLIEDSVKLEAVERYREEGRLSELVVKTDAVFSELPALLLGAEAERFVRNGNALPPKLLKECTVLCEGTPAETGECLRAEEAGIAWAEWKNAQGALPGRIRVYGRERTFLAVYEWNAQRRCLCAGTMFL